MWLYISHSYSAAWDVPPVVEARTQKIIISKHSPWNLFNFCPAGLLCCCSSRFERAVELGKDFWRWRWITSCYTSYVNEAKFLTKSLSLLVTSKHLKIANIDFGASRWQERLQAMKLAHFLSETDFHLCSHPDEWETYWMKVAPLMKSYNMQRLRSCWLGRGYMGANTVGLL